MTSQEDSLYQAKFYARKLTRKNLETLMYELEKIYLDGQDPAVVLTTDAPACGGAQVDEQDKDENDRPKACPAKRHSYFYKMEALDDCPICGERLSS